MSVRISVFRRSGPLAAAALIVPVLAGCSSVPSMPSISSFSSLFGSNPTADTSQASAAYTPPPDFECPSVTIRQGASTLAVYANPAERLPTTLRYQVGISQMARECKLVGTTVSMKVGVQGRVILGPEGGPGQVDVPLRFAVVHEGVQPKTIATKLDRVPVSIPPNDANVSFSYIAEDLSFPMPSGGQIDSYVVYVGFDPLGAKEMDKKTPAPKPGRPRRRT
jgi:hypothetical protein